MIDGTTRRVNAVTLGVEHFGDPSASLVLCIGGPTLLSWPDSLCAELARLGRHVVRYDLRDCGASTTLDPEAPRYTLRDLASDAAALARELDDRPAGSADLIRHRLSILFDTTVLTPDRMSMCSDTTPSREEESSSG